jgi:Fe-S oxidoreductase
VIHKESLCINCGCCVSECNAMESGPRSSSGRRRSRRGCASSATRATPPRPSGSTQYSTEHGIWECTRCYFCNERCPEGRRPRDAIAKLGAEAMKEGHRRRHGREAREAGSSSPRRRPAGCARRSSCRRHRASSSSIKEMKFAMGLRSTARSVPSRRTSPRASRSRAPSTTSSRRRTARARWDRPGRACALAARARGPSGAAGERASTSEWAGDAKEDA